MHDSEVHRSLVATAASLKSCLRSVSNAVATNSSSDAVKFVSAVKRGAESAAQARQRLEGLSAQTQRLPLETSKRLIEVNLPEQIQALLDAYDPSASWAADCDPIRLPAVAHPAWQPLQQCIIHAFSCLALLSDVAAKACARSLDPLLVLEQLACQDLAAKCSQYLQRQQQVFLAQISAEGGLHLPAASGEPDKLLSETAKEDIVNVIAAFASFYGPLAAATDAQPGLEQVQLQLMAALCSTKLLPAACQLLLSTCASQTPAEASLSILSAAGAVPPSQTLAALCQQAGHDLLTLALLLSGDSTVTSWYAQEQHGNASSGGGASGAAESTASSGHTGATEGRELLRSSLVQQLSASPVLQLLEERLYHVGRDMSFLGMAPELARIPLLPGRAIPDSSYDMLAAALRVLRCWRALLRCSPAIRPQLASAPDTFLLLLGVLNSAAAESPRTATSDRQSLRGRVCKVGVECLQLLSSYLPPMLVQQVLPSAVSTLGKVVAAAPQYWAARKHSVKSVELPYSGQIRCVERSTGDTMKRLNEAAELALDVLQTLVLMRMRARAASGYAGCSTPGPCDELLQDAALMGAVEQVFRCIPAASQIHVAAAEFLALVLPNACCPGGSCFLGTAQLALLTTLRKFLVSSTSLPEPDRELAVHVTLALEDLLGRLVAEGITLADSMTTVSGIAVSADGSQEKAWQNTEEDWRGGDAMALCQLGIAQGKLQLLLHALVQVLPGVQAICMSLLRNPEAGLVTFNQGGQSQHLFVQLVQLMRQLGVLHSKQPALKVGPLVLAYKSLSVTASVLQTGFYNTLRGVAAPADLTVITVGEACISLLEQITGQLAANISPALTTSTRLAAGFEVPTAAEETGLWNSSKEEAVPACVEPASPTTCKIGQQHAHSPLVVEVLADAFSMSPPIPAVLSADQQPSAEQQQLLLGLLQSNLLPEAQRLLQQLQMMRQGGEGGEDVFGAVLSRSNSGQASTKGMPVPQTAVQSDNGSKQVLGSSPTFSQSLSDPGNPSLSSQRLVPVATATAAAIARENSLRDTLPVIGVSIPSAIKTRSSVSRTGSGALGAQLRGGSPTYALLSSTGGGVPARASTFSRGATPVSGVGGSSPRYFDNNSFGSFSSMGSGMLGGILSPASARGGGRASSCGMWQQGTQDGGQGGDVMDPVARQLQQRLEGVLLQVTEMVLAVGQASGQQAAAVVGKVGVAELKAGEAASSPSAFASAAGAACAAAVAGGSSPTAAAAGVCSGSLPKASSGGMSFNYSYGSALGSVSKPMSFEDVLVNLQAALDSARVAKAAASASAQIAATPLAALPSVPAAGGCAPGSISAVAEEGEATLAKAVADVALEEAALGARRSDGGTLSPGASPETAACPIPMQPLPMAMVRRLLSLCASAAAFLGNGSNTSGVAGSLVSTAAAAAAGPDTSCSIDVLLSQLQPAPVGCWNTGCSYMGGVCEAKVALKTCPTCQVAVYCSKACEKSAWSQHKLACGQLKEQGNRLAAATASDGGAAGGGRGGASEGNKGRVGRSFDSGRTRPFSGEGGGSAAGLHPRISDPGALYTGRYKP